jgi:catechol 2,3-dioxygenase-like lactoylglutathione lyase family enzyme
MNINQIDHCALTVTNLDRSFYWLKHAFGLEIIHTWETTWMVGKGQIKLGLFQRPEGKPIDDLNNKIGFQHVAFPTDYDGFIAAQAYLKSKEIEFDGPEDSGIAYSIFLKDPDGNLFEITTYHLERS